MKDLKNMTKSEARREVDHLIHQRDKMSAEIREIERKKQKLKEYKKAVKKLDSRIEDLLIVFSDTDV